MTESMGWRRGAASPSIAGFEIAPGSLPKIMHERHQEHDGGDAERDLLDRFAARRAGTAMTQRDDGRQEDKPGQENAMDWRIRTLT